MKLWKRPKSGLSLSNVCQPPYRGSCKISLNTKVFFKFFFRDLFIKFDPDKLKELFFEHLLVVTTGRFTLFTANTFFLMILEFFYPNRGFKRSFFTFFVFLGLVFRIWVLSTWRTFLWASSGSKQKKKLTLSGANTQFLTKIILQLFNPNRDFKR